MKTGVCPKCGGMNIKKFVPKGVVGDSSAWDYEYVGAFKMARTSRYVCLDCGFCERYFEESELQKIRDRDKKERGEF